MPKIFPNYRKRLDKKSLFSYIKFSNTQNIRIMRKGENYEYLKNIDNRETLFKDFCKKEEKNEICRKL